MRRGLYSVALAVLVAALASGCGLSLPFFETEESAFEAGMTLLASREYKEALARFSAAAEQGEGSAALYRGIGIAQFHLGDQAAAEEAFVEGLHRCHGIPDQLAYDTAYYLAQTYAAQGRPGDAVGVYDAILGLRPGEKDARYLRGLMYLKENDHDRAAADFQSVLEERPRPYDRILTIYEALSEAGYQTEGRQMLEEILADGSSMSDYEKARFYYHLGDPESARGFLEAANAQVGARSPEKVPIVILLGEVCQDLGDDTGAVAVYRRYLQENQSQAAVYNAMGVCEMRMGNYSDALSDFQIGLSLDDETQNALILRNMVAAYEHMGNFELASQRMEEYLELDPSDEEAMRESIFLRTRLQEQGEQETERVG